MKRSLARWIFAALIVAGCVPVQAGEIAGDYNLSVENWSGAPDTTVITSDGELVFNGDFYFDGGVTIMAPKVSIFGGSFKLGSGDLVLNPKNTTIGFYNGTTTITSGALNNSSNLLAAGSVTINASGMDQTLGNLTIKSDSVIDMSQWSANASGGLLTLQGWTGDIPELTLESLGEIQCWKSP